MTEQEKLPPKMDLAEVGALQVKLDAYFARWEQWSHDRQSWLIVANRADSFGDLARLYELGLRLAVARPDKAKETRAFIDELVHLPDTGRGRGWRRPEWVGDYTEENAGEMRNKCRNAVYALQERFEELGVPVIDKEML